MNRGLSDRLGRSGAPRESISPLCKWDGKKWADTAIMVLTVDQEIPAAVLDQIKEIEGIDNPVQVWL